MTKSARRSTGRKSAFRGGVHGRQPHGARTSKVTFKSELDDAPDRILRHLYNRGGIEVRSRDALIATLAKSTVVHRDIRALSQRMAIVRLSLQRLENKKRPAIEFDLVASRCRYRVTRTVAKQFDDPREQQRRAHKTMVYDQRQLVWERARAQERRVREVSAA